MIEMGIVSTGTWFPETYVTAAEIAEQSGLPEWVVREKLGIERKLSVPGVVISPPPTALARAPGGSVTTSTTYGSGDNISFTSGSAASTVTC